jgi:hypothetical protein
MRVLVNKIVIEICKFKKYLHIIKQFWLKLLNNAINLLKSSLTLLTII